jgi:hypothetical protein
MDAFGDPRIWGANLGHIFDISANYHALYRTSFKHEAKASAGKGRSDDTGFGQ